MIGETALIAYTASVSVVMFYMVADLGKSITRWILGTPSALKNVITEVIPEILVSTLNNTLVLRNQAVNIAVYVGAGALQIINNVKDIIVYIIGGSIQEVVKVLHLIVHIGVQALQLIRNIYRFVFSGMEAVYVVVKTVNDGIHFTINGVSIIIYTIVSTPERMYNFTIQTIDSANQSVHSFIDDTVYPTIDWFLYGPKISNTRYYLFLLTCICLCSIYNWYRNSKYSKRNYVPKFTPQQEQEQEEEKEQEREKDKEKTA